ncbi:uncharacterized protein [Eleutherodactylus coqui]|uniref:uncharacterized protein n=1 Tax=Eleutherodactylus coqui TaxID=57060 RepID=UPI0034630785
MKIKNRKYQIFCMETNKEFRNALDTWSLMEEAASGSCVPDFIQGMAAEDLITYVYVFKKAILSERLLPGDSIAICRFFISVIQYRKDAAYYMKEYMANVLCEHMKTEYMKGRYSSYVMAKKVLIWLSILYLRAVVRELRYNILYEELNAAIIDTLTEVTSLCTKVVIPHIVDLLPVMSRVVKDAHDQPSKETLCYAIKRLSGSVQKYMRNDDRYNKQLMTVMCNIKTNTSTWLPDVHGELQDSTKAALHPFTTPDPSEDRPAESYNDELPTFPHTTLLEMYRDLMLKELKKAVDAEKQQTEMSALVISLLSGKKITKDFLQFLLKNAAPKTRMTAIIFFSEALKHHRLMKEKDQKSAMQHLLKIIEDNDDLLCSLAIEGLGNAVTGAPGLVERYKKKIIACLELRLSKTTNPKVIMAALRALSSIIRCLKLSVLSRQFINICREHMAYPDEKVQIAAINLLRDLTESCRLPLFDYFTEEVRSFIPTLLLKLHSDNQEMAAASTSSLQSCLSYIKRSSIKGFFRTEKSLTISDRESIYIYLARSHPKLMKALLLQTPDNLANTEDKEAVVTHVVFLKDVIDQDVLQDTDVDHLSQELARLHSEGFPMNVRQATEEAIGILATKWFHIGYANRMTGLTP